MRGEEKKKVQIPVKNICTRRMYFSQKKINNKCVYEQVLLNPPIRDDSFDPSNDDAV